MSQVLHILFGAAFTVALCLAAGWMLVRRLRLPLRGGEVPLVGFLAGAPCVSTGMFGFSAVHAVRRGVILVAGLAVIGWAARLAWREYGPMLRSMPRPDLRHWLRSLSCAECASYALLVAFFLIVYFPNALAPEVSPDGSGYHLTNVSLYWVRHGFAWDCRTLYSALSQGMEMLFLVAFGFGQHSAAALVHLAFLTALPLLVLAYGRRFGLQRIAVPAALVAFTSPVAGISGVSAYNDLAVATLSFAVFFLLQVWDEDGCDRFLILCGLLAGFVFAVKYSAAVVTVFAVAFIWLRSRRLIAILKVLLPSVTVALPWVLRNWIWLGNPAAPFLNSWFPNPYFYPGVERDYLDGLKHYPEVSHYWNIPWDVIVTGGLVPGMTGPFFLLAPLALLALASRQGRRLVAAAFVFTLPAWVNTEPRFLIPGLVFVVLAVGLSLRRRPGVFAAISIATAVLCLPPSLSAYAHRYSWHLRGTPWRAALRLESEDEFLARRIPEYLLRLPIRRFVPQGEKVFSFAGRPSAYFEREIVVGYESALGNFAQDTLMAPIDHTPDTRMIFRFAPAEVRGVRLVQSEPAGAYWTVSELRVASEGGELAPTPRWRISAAPNPWEAGLALDGNGATRWSTWDRTRAGNWLGIEFGAPLRIDRVVNVTSSANTGRVELEILSVNNSWNKANATLERVPAAPDSGLRRAATRALRLRGIGHLLVNESDFPAADMRQAPEAWGLVQEAEAAGVRLYRIEP